MKVIELVKFNRELLSRMKAAGIKLEDAQYVDLYQDYVDMLSSGAKVSYVVMILADKYSVSERKVYALIKHFKSDCKSLADGSGGGYGVNTL